MKLFRVIAVVHLTKDTFRLRIERPDAPILAGQCFNVGIPGGSINREYSMYSDANGDYLDFLIKVVEGGSLAPKLQKLKVGDLVEIDGPYGQFYLYDPLDNSKKYTFLATGTGVAPFHSFVSTYPSLNYRLIHGVRYPNEQYDFKDYAIGSYIPCISKNNLGSKSMRLTEFLIENPPSSDEIVYLCGNRNMIVESFEILRNQGIPGDNLFTEVFF
jgi:ferredoxin--NADP+ reductase